ncbi:MAG: hypothetical protein J6X53_00635, partial [Abditibacteriota bacterium]|nr:hypothetical protein [Abditibacteriota bacterium]
PPRPVFRLFPDLPSPEEQIERIAEINAEEQRAAQASLDLPVKAVPPDGIDHALTSGGNERRSIERIVAFFQKSPDTKRAAAFLADEFHDGYKGVTIGGKKYAIHFNKDGYRIAHGDRADVSGATLVPWTAVAERISALLLVGQFAEQSRIDAARENEFQELSAALWYLRRDFSDEAREANYLPLISEAYNVRGGYPEETLQIGELLKNRESSEKVTEELLEFAQALRNNSELLRFNGARSVVKSFTQLQDLHKDRTEYRAADGFQPVHASFITQDEIDNLLRGEIGSKDSQFRAYSYYIQGHNAQEFADFLKSEAGLGGGGGYWGYDNWRDSKGVKLTRADEYSGYDGYDTVFLNWTQVEKRVRGMIEENRFLSEQDRAEMPRFERLQLAYSINSFLYYAPKEQNERLTVTHSIDSSHAEKVILPMLENPEQSAAIYRDMQRIMESVDPGARNYDFMSETMRDMEAYQKGEYSLFTPLPESVLEAEREKRKAEKEAKRAEKERQREERQRRKQEAQDSADEPPVSVESVDTVKPDPQDRSGIDLAAAARALAKKARQSVKEHDSGQFSFFDQTEESAEESATEMPELFEPEPSTPEQTAEQVNPEPPKQAEQESPSAVSAAMDAAETANATDAADTESIGEAQRDDYLLIRQGDIIRLYEEKAR